jgi:hypothetical protein
MLHPNQSTSEHVTTQREIIAPADCTGFTPEQERALDASYAKWQNSGYAVSTGEEYVALRRKYQYANMLKSLGGA